MTTNVYVSKGLYKKRIERTVRDEIKKAEIGNRLHDGIRDEAGIIICELYRSIGILDDITEDDIIENGNWIVQNKKRLQFSLLGTTDDPWRDYSTFYIGHSLYIPSPRIYI